MVITIATEPVAKGRPRFTRNGRVYTPTKTREYESLIRKQIQLQRIQPTDKPVRLKISFYKSVPKSYSQIKRKKAIKGEIYPMVRPDLDNYVKAILDASNGLLYEDDNQVIEIEACKRYASMPYVEIELTELGE